MRTFELINVLDEFINSSIIVSIIIVVPFASNVLVLGVNNYHSNTLIVSYSV